MSVLQSHVATGGEEFRRNRDAYAGLIAQLHRRRSEYEGMGQRARDRHESLGKLLPRDRVDVLLDPGSPFLELGELAGIDMYDSVPPGAGIITGIGQVGGVSCMIIANDAPVKGGTYYTMTAKKHVRAQKIAWQHRLPNITLVDSGGANLPEQPGIFPDVGQYGSVFNQLVRQSAEGIPQISVVHGACTAGGTYVPALCDITIIVREQGYLHLGGPELTFAATGEDVDRETLGGAQMHSSISGVTDYLAENDRHALAMVRDVVGDTCRRAPLARAVRTPAEPRYDPGEIHGLIPEDPRLPADIREILARLVDDSYFDEFKLRYGESLICGFAYIGGFKVGILANQGVIFSDSALKAVHFIDLCCKQDIPLLFMADNSGFMVGREAEHGGISKDGAKMITAMASANVPKYNIIIGKSYGAGYMAMCSRPFEPHFAFGWPNGRAALMGPEQAAITLAMVQRQKRARDGEDWPAEAEEAFKEPIRRDFEAFASMYNFAANLWIDGILDPAETRQVMTLLLDLAARVPGQASPFGVLRM
ncbi:MAG: carboxyl transferase domain-containing protein [Alphaproteobacteria bacterium]|jgi:3-methylcrotonyl-CoA carboxylase beta subunit|nr:carboxyl transferase domain-containing protein [Alphaproteobacteria bacterium]MDP6567375.1 carboxyl transferase domain-containing protein [Alphaproteobacteria bacterium]MDP6814662.1 carboxyl transferase domain-containing protein [Alphaproteobacteria bacterium]